MNPFCKAGGNSPPAPLLNLFHCNFHEVGVAGADVFVVKRNAVHVHCYPTTINEYEILVEAWEEPEVIMITRLEEGAVMPLPKLRMSFPDHCPFLNCPRLYLRINVHFSSFGFPR